MPTGKPERREGESSGDDSKKRTASPSLDDDGSDSTDSRRSRRKKPRVCVCWNIRTHEVLVVKGDCILKPWKINNSIGKRDKHSFLNVGT